MRIRLLGTTATALAAALILVGSGIVSKPAHAAAAAPCNRACLDRFANQFLAALAAHDPWKLRLTKDVRFTENGQHLALGDGLWRTTTGLGTFRMIVPDTAAERVAFLGSIREAGAPTMLAFDLAIRHHRIAEIETLVQHSVRSAKGFEKIGYKWTQIIPRSQRMSRANLVRIANMYFSGMQQNNGKGVYPFAKDCNRIENGMFTTNRPTPAGQKRPNPRTADMYSAQWSCMEQFKSGLLHFVTRIRDRRFVAVDPRRGLVFAFVFFDHSAGNTRTFRTPDGRTVTAGPKQPWTWEIAETFKIEHAKIHQIMAIMNHVPYGMSSGWSTWEQAFSSRARYLGPSY